MSGQTMVFGAVSRRSEKWRVYRIRTANSTYELEVEGERAGGRRCAVLTCVEPKDRAGQSFEDSSPQVDGVSLFSLSPMEWMGKALALGTARTSPIQSVDFVAATDAPASRARLTTGLNGGYQPHEKRAGFPREERPREAPAPTWAAFPEGHVQMVETAATLLKIATHRPDLFAAVRDDSNLDQRLRLSLTQCRLMLDALQRKS
jgi:hypothetical protein